jgi:hypothetical protein
VRRPALLSGSPSRLGKRLRNRKPLKHNPRVIIYTEHDPAARRAARNRWRLRQVWKRVVCHLPGAADVPIMERSEQKEGAIIYARDEFDLDFRGGPTGEHDRQKAEAEMAVGR